MTATLNTSTIAGPWGAGRPIEPSEPATRRRRAPRSVPAATYRRRRAVVGTVLATIVACGAVVTHDVLAGSGGVPASAAEGLPAQVRSTVTAQPGDTLWSIAHAHRGEIAVSRFVDKLVDLNGGASIRAGQQVVLP
jgi:nucleoid-associated protein YgaU